MKSIFLQLSEPDLKGESMDKDHGQWIELEGMSHQIHRPTSSSVSTSGGHAVGPCAHGDMVLTKAIDQSSPLLYQAASSGTTFKAARIDVYRDAGDGARVKYLEIQLKNVMLAHVGFTLDGSPTPRDSIALRYAAIQWTYIKQGIDGSQGGTTQGAWSLSKHGRTFAV